jgi:hypothetical protein
LSYWEEAEVKRQIDVLVDLGKMRPSDSEYACRVTLPVKKDGSRRFCGDYRPLNLQTRRDSFPMPLVEDVISQLGKSVWFTALDLQSGFWQIRMAPDDMKKTALVTKTGLYDWTVMPFGLKNATSTFTRTMSLVFKELGDIFLKVFVDDLNVHSESWEDHLRHLEAVLSKLREVNLKLNPGKCCFAARSITFSGHVVSERGARPDPGKIDAVVRFPEPRTVTDVRSFLGLTGYYWKYVQGYSRLAGPLFDLTRKAVAFVWSRDCQQAFDILKKALVDAPTLIRPDFSRPFCLDVDWSTRGVGAILSQKEGRFEKVVAYASKGLTVAQRRFHPMEGECYALIWGIMHFRQYLHRTRFTLRIDHKPLEWLATVSDASGRRGRWIHLLQDFDFKIVHQPGLRHTNVDALSRNPVGKASEDDDFNREIQDVGPPRDDPTEEMFAVRCDQHSDWFGFRRTSREFAKHQRCCSGINRGYGLEEHQLLMLDVVTETSPLQEHNKSLAQEKLQGTRTSSPTNRQAEADNPRVEVVGAVADEGMGTGHRKQEPRKEIIRHYDKCQQLELVLAAQKLTESDDLELDPTEPSEEEGHEDDIRTVNIWSDVACLTLLRDGVLPDTMDVEESKRVRKRVSNYYIRSERLYFRDLYVPKPEERTPLVIQIHEDLGHAREERTLTEVCRRYFWHHQTGDVRTVVKTCQQCQMVRRLGSVRSEDEEMRSIPICDLFHRVAMDTAGPLPATKSGNRYLLVAIDHYSKWCEAKAVGDHGAKTAASFFEDDIICRYDVPKFILTDNGGEWAA